MGPTDTCRLVGFCPPFFLLGEEMGIVLERYWGGLRDQGKVFQDAVVAPEHRKNCCQGLSQLPLPTNPLASTAWIPPWCPAGISRAHRSQAGTGSTSHGGPRSVSTSLNCPGGQDNSLNRVCTSFSIHSTTKSVEMSNPRREEARDR